MLIIFFCIFNDVGNYYNGSNNGNIFSNDNNDINDHAIVMMFII